jgi:hypothetical protein
MKAKVPPFAENRAATSVSSQDSLEAWLGRLERRWQLRRCETETEAHKETQHIQHPAWTEEELETDANRHFQTLALQYHEAVQFLRLSMARQKVRTDQRRLAQQDRQTDLRAAGLDLAREKQAFDGAAQCLRQLPKLRHIAAQPHLTTHQKINEIRKVLFGFLPEDEKPPAAGPVPPE